MRPWSCRRTTFERRPRSGLEKRLVAVTSVAMTFSRHCERSEAIHRREKKEWIWFRLRSLSYGGQVVASPLAMTAEASVRRVRQLTLRTRRQEFAREDFRRRRGA